MSKQTGTILLAYVYICLVVNLVISENLENHEIVLCRKCGSDIADVHYLVEKLSPGAWKNEKRKVFNDNKTTVQKLVNPFGVVFEIVTFEKSRCSPIGAAQRADSWFPGYTWRVCVCPHCGHHLGWIFEQMKPEDGNNDTKIFHGLILDNLLGENFTDSILTMPRTYVM